MNLAICDDQPEFLEIFRGQLETYFDRFSLSYQIYAYTDGKQLLESDIWLDIAFMDIKMGDISGLETARLLRKKNLHVKIIFLTAYKQYVFQAFDVDASHYLIKPVSNRKLSQVLDHVIEQIQEAENQFVLFKTGSSLIRVPVNEIIYIEVMDRKVFVHSKDGIQEFYGRLDQLEKQLPSNFYRCHRSFIANLSSVIRLEKTSLFLSDGSAIPISKRKYSELAKLFMQMLQREELK